MYIKYCRTSFALEQFDGIESACHKTLILYFEGAIYNRPFLQSLLPSQDTALSEEDDNAALLLVLFQSFGEALIPKLLGDFILAIYDRDRQTWFCARDHMGVRPFFYYADENYFVFGSDIAAIAADEHVPDELCNESIAIFLREGELYDSQLTFHKHIKRIKPANTLTLDQGGIRFRCYWRPEDLDRRTFESEEQCARELLKLLQDAVNIRIDPNKSTGVHLSGGLDSSAITALAAPILRTYGKSTHSFSWLPPPNGGQRGDPEWAPGELLASEFGLNHHYTPFGARDISEILNHFNLLDFDNVDLWYEHKVRELANQNGVNVILSGWGGDEFVSYHGAYRCFETFWGGRPISTLRNLYAATQNQPNRFFACLKLCFEELVLRPLPGWALFWRKGRYDYDYLAASSDDFAIYARGLRRRLRRRSRLSVRGNMLLNLRQGHIENRLESWAVSGKKKGIEYRYPLLDKRLVEFALSIPPDYFFKRGVPRYIFRMAIRDVVPSYVWERNRKEEPHRVREMIDQTVKAITDWPTTRASASHIIQEHKLERLSRELVGKVQEVSLQSLVAVFLVVKSILVVNTELAQENHPPVE